MNHAGLGFHTRARSKTSASGFTLPPNPPRKTPSVPTPSVPTPSVPVRVHSGGASDRRPAHDNRGAPATSGDAQRLYDEMQVVYAQAKGSLRVRADLDDGASETSSVPHDTWLQLLYPMRQTANANTHRVFMRFKCVDPDTGQLSIAWACVHERDKQTGLMSRHVGPFTLFPGSD